MAWVFSLSAELGPDKNGAEQFSRHFEDASWVLSSGARAQCLITVFQDTDESWWCRVCPSGVSEIGIAAPESAYLMTELGILLHQKLRTAPAFRYALVGVEVDEFRTYSELLDEPSNLSLPGLVLSDAVWQAMNSPSTFRPFSTGYVWQPYEGEVYKPLVVSPS
ncbi:MAG: hypothetical protein AAF215_22015 [Cyanobacteria bacterium P01_A01_bin.123]